MNSPYNEALGATLIERTKRERIVLVGVTMPGRTDDDTEAGLDELALLIDTLNPERIVLGGYFPRCAALLVPAMHRALAAEALPSALAGCKILPAVLGETIGSNAAVAVALHAVDTLPAQAN